MDLVKLQKLLIVKLSEKFSLNVRGLKQAFALYDKDGNGLLDLAELQKGLSMFLNGVQSDLLEALVAAYDMNGDGMLSYEEFLAVLQNPKILEDNASTHPNDNNNNKNSGRRVQRKEESLQNDKMFGKKGETKYANADYDMFGNDLQTANRNNSNRFPPAAPALEFQQPTRDARGSAARRPQSAQDSIFSFNNSDVASQADSHIDLSSPGDLEARARAFLNSLKAYFHEQALQLRQAGKAGDLKDRLNVSSTHLLDGIARGLLAKSFQQYTGLDDGRSRQGSKQYVELAEFAKVLRSFRVVGRGGGAALRVETIHFLFSLCHPDTGADDVNLGVADPNVMAVLLFGAPALNPREQVSARRNVAAGVTTTASDDANQVMGLSLVDRAERGRQVVGSGPVKPVSGKDRKANDVPLRFTSRRSRTTFAVPASFDQESGQSYSSKEPAYDLDRRHVHGFNCKLYSGNAMVALASGSSANPTGLRTDPDFLDNSVVVYAAAALGIVHDLSTNSQNTFGGHDYDVTCIAISNCTQYVATGSSGARKSCIHVWESRPSDQFGLTGQDPTSLAKIGEGFFDRAVCAVSFLEDPNFVCGIGCDDAHTLGIWDIRDPANTHLVSQTTQNGIPPQIKSMKWAPHQEYTEYITKTQRGLCDVGCTAGEHHLRLWSFRRPVIDNLGTQEVAQLSSRGAIFGELRKQVQPPKIYTAVDFAPCSDKTSDIIAGGSNGIVYLFRKGKCIAYQNAIKGGVRCLQVSGDTVVCGGKAGSVVCLNIRTLAIQLQCRAAYPPPVTRNLDGYTQASGRAVSATARPLSASSSTSKGGGLESDEDLGDIIGLAAISSSKGGITHAIVSSSNGRTMKVDFTKAIEANRANSASAGKRPFAPSMPTNGVSTLFYFHTGELWGLAVGSARSHHLENSQLSRKLTLLATTGDDRRLSIWDPERRCLSARTILPAASRCVDFHRSAQFIVCGTMSGSVHVYAMVVDNRRSAAATPASAGKGAVMAPATRMAREQAEHRRSKQYTLTEVAFRRDFREAVSDVKFSPSGDMIAAASNDDTICLYSCETIADNNTVSCTLKPLHRLRGHSSYITHLDWSRDGQLLRSTCGAYELLYWNALDGKQFTGPQADLAFKTDNCPLGFGMMGIWPPYSDGTDVNGVDVGSLEDGNSGNGDKLVFTGDDNAKVSVMNYPCIVKHAPRKEYAGHGSHVTNVRFYNTFHNRDSLGNPYVASTGGRDSTLITWGVTATPVAPPVRKYVHKLTA